MNKLFWLVFKKGGDITVFIQPAGALGMARLKAALAGIDGEFQEGYALDAKMTKKVPKRADSASHSLAKQATAPSQKADLSCYPK